MARYLSLGLSLSLLVSGVAACSGSSDGSSPRDSAGGGAGEGGTGGTSASTGGSKSSNGGEPATSQGGAANPSGMAGQASAGAPAQSTDGGGAAELGGAPGAAGSSSAGNPGAGAANAGAPNQPAEPPELTDFTPKLGLPGEVVTITGQNFATSKGDDVVTIGGVAAEVLTATATELSVEVPALAVTGKVKVSVGGNDATSTDDFEVLKDIPRQGLVAFYPMSGDATDQSGNQLDGTVNGASLTTDRFGHVSHAYSFDGVNDYITMGNPAKLQIDTAITLAVWAKASTYTYGLTLISKLDDAQNAGYRFTMGETGNGSKGYTVYVTSDGTGLNFAKLSNDLVADTWTLLVFALDGNAMRFDQGDGWVFEANNHRSLTNGALGDFKLGTMSPNGSYFAGSIDDVAVYNRKLTADEIKQLHDQTVSKR